MSTLKQIIKSWRVKSSVFRIIYDAVRFVFDGILLAVGIGVHLVRRTTPKFSHMALVRMFAYSGGVVNDGLSAVISKLYPKYSLQIHSSDILTDGGPVDFAAVQSQMILDGYCVLSQRLSAEFCDRVYSTVLDKKFLVRSDTADKQIHHLITYDQANPVAAQYILQKDDVTDIPEVQELLTDPVLITIAQNYLNAPPIFSGLAMDLSPAINGVPDKDAAQEYHWDLERIRWIRFFIYLTDVTTTTGPHCFVKGTHKTNGIARKYLDQGYGRFSDESVITEYGINNIMEFTGIKGTIIAEDSRGLHKGKVPLHGERLLLAFELSNSLFGVNKRHKISTIHNSELKEYVQKYPRIYSNLDIQT